jgi:HlyD family secretion protein/epimerase transport system membrane fusion protein
MPESNESHKEDNQKETNLLFPKRPSSSTRNVTIFGFFVVAIIFIGLGVWSSTAPLAQAVAAFATLVVKGDRKQIQHFEGGQIEALHVTEGQMVQKGQLLVSLNPLQASALVARHDAQLYQALARGARLQSELAGSSTIILDGAFLERLNKDENVFDILEAEQRHDCKA